MSEKLDKAEVQQWIKGQKEAQKVIAREKTRWLQSLTQEESLRIYLELKAAAPDDPNRTDVSPVLWAMRKAAQKLAEKRGENNGQENQKEDQALGHKII